MPIRHFQYYLEHIKHFFPLQISRSCILTNIDRSLATMVQHSNMGKSFCLVWLVVVRFKSNCLAMDILDCLENLDQSLALFGLSSHVLARFGWFGSFWLALVSSFFRIYEKENSTERSSLVHLGLFVLKICIWQG